MKNWKELEGYNNGSVFSRFNGIPLYLNSNTFVLCTFPRLFTPHCSNELTAADDLLLEFKDVNIPIIFASNDSPEVAEQYFGKNPVGFPFIRINRRIERDLGVIDRFGDAHRATYYIKDGEIKHVDVFGFDYERDFWKVLIKAKEVLL